MTLNEFKKKARQFTAWLVECGAEVLVPTNEYELLRFRGNNGTSIIYQNMRGQITCVGESEIAWNAFKTSTPWKANVPARRKLVKNITVRAIRKRDGDLCFLCAAPVSDDEASVDHLVPATSGGPSHIANYVLAHARCNQAAGHKSAMEKIRMHVKAAMATHGIGVISARRLEEILG